MMQSDKDFKLLFDEITFLRSKQEFSEALKKVENLLKQECLKYSPYLLRQRAELIQLINDVSDLKQSYSLDSIESDLKTAILFDPKSISALIELGYFLYAAKDNPRDSLQIFEKAEEFSKNSLEEAMFGKIKAIEDINGPKIALKELSKMERVFPKSKKVIKYKKFLKDSILNSE